MPQDGSIREADVHSISGLRVLTLNLRNNEDHWQARFDLVAEQLSDLRPDIVAVQELQIGDEQSRELFDRLARHDNPLDYHIYEQLKSGVFDILGEGLAIYSLFPFEQTDVLPLDEGRIALFARIGLPNGTTFDVYNVHLHYEKESQREQIRKVLSWIDELSQGQDVVLMGDFNAEPGSEIHQLAVNRFVDAFAELHPSDLGYTFAHTLSMDHPTHNLRSRLDYVFYDLAPTSSWSLTSTEVTLNQDDETGLMPSDHLGVTSVFTLQP